MNKHTPGPWMVCKEPKNDYWKAGITIGAESEKDGRRVCDVSQWDNDPFEGMTAANARLIAAAPELLEALEEIIEQLDTCEGGYYVSDTARAAIAKAKGETK